MGDIHGELSALNGLWEELRRAEVGHTVFLGDYINKGPDSAAVMTRLLSLSNSGLATLLAGNHEKALLEAVDSGTLTAFLKMGGATTIRSYVGQAVGPRVLQDFLPHVPPEHLSALRRMPIVFQRPGVLAQHVPATVDASAFRVTAHIQVGTRPRLTHETAEIHTGCGSDPEGLLTGLLWPSLDYIQVDMRGDRV